MASFYVEVWDGSQWKRLPDSFPTRSAADRWLQQRCLRSPRVVRVEASRSEQKVEAA
jgi:hypothetical protein